ncbi:hypothetical protein ACPOL_5498 [Acidisarcina polymorpha]|uniref:Uncharacterized protein n=1 Tax=Acidisarcina polymorpha TaxID=2211140 RepID=A0A2Z5G842_9BACT|nr:hypothetical protein ACPOL_5498 [Acidisarcina polymorpha]
MSIFAAPVNFPADAMLGPFKKKPPDTLCKWLLHPILAPAREPFGPFLTELQSAI